MESEDEFEDNIGILNTDAANKKGLDEYIYNTEGSESSDESSIGEIDERNNDGMINVDCEENISNYCALVEDEEDIIAYEYDTPLSGDDNTSEYGDFIAHNSSSTTRDVTSIPPLKPGVSRLGAFVLL